MTYNNETIEDAIKKRNKVFGDELYFAARLIIKAAYEVINQTDRDIYCLAYNRIELYHSGDVTLHKGADDFYLSEEEKTMIKKIIK